MIRHLAIAAAFLCASFALPAQAQDGSAGPSVGIETQAPALSGVLDAIRLHELLAIMAQENSSAASAMETELFPGRGGAAWIAIVTNIHSVDRIIARFEDVLAADTLDAAQIAAAEGFFRSEIGAQVVAGELAARRAFLDDDARAAAEAALVDAMEAANSRLALLERFNESLGLVERNVSAALNATYAFYRGLAEGGAHDMEMPDDLIIAEVWAQEAGLRRATIEWLYSYQLTAYEGLGDAEFAHYLAFAESPAGTAFYSALFEAYETVFTEVSFELGQAAAAFLSTDDI